MKKRSQLFLFLLLLALPFQAANAQAQTALSISPATTTVQAGQSATLAVRITDVTDLYAYDITLRYDPSLVEITAIDNGSFLQGGFTAAQILDKTAGTAQLAFTSIPPFTAQSGSGELATFKVKAKSGGSARITIENIQLLKKDATAIKAATSSGMVTVTGGAATEAPRPGANPGGNDAGQPLDALNPGAGVSPTQQGAPATLPANASGGQNQPNSAPTKRSTVVPAVPVAEPESAEDGKGLSPLVWMVPAALLLLAGGYFGGNFLRDRTQKKK